MGKLLLVLPLFFLLISPAQSQQKLRLGGGYPFVEIGGGAALWQQSMQSEFQPESIPVQAFVEKGNTGSPIGFGAGINLLSDYSASNFNLQQRYATLYLRYNLPQVFSSLDKFQAFPMVGALGWDASLTDPGKPGVVDYERKVETDRGIGLMAGFGVAYQVGNLSISPRFHAFFAGQGGYLAGQFEDQNLNVGIFQATLNLSYRFYLAKGYRLNKKIQCPTF